MNVIEFIRNGMLISSAIIVIYVVADLFIKKKKYMGKQINEINNNRYVALIVIDIIIYIIYGILRNF